MLQSLEIEIDINGHLHSLEPIPVGRRGILTLFDEKTSPLSASPTPAKHNPFQDLYGILTAGHGVSLEEMEQAIFYRSHAGASLPLS
ncbi:MAG: hypothetical protein PHU14_10535 [Methylovulum sp.]|nr:hypothetical protein [Methylovulum sp.]